MPRAILRRPLTPIGRLAALPGIGAIREHSKPSFAGMRMWPLPEFPKYLIFYRATDEELRVIRVLHGAQDPGSIFKQD